jgi:type III secretion protein R
MSPVVANVANLATVANSGSGLDRGPLPGLSPTWLIAAALLSLLPFLLLMLTSFVKVTVVLSILKSAIGGGQVPPSSIVTGLSAILTLFIMAPTGQRMYRALADGTTPGPNGVPGVLARLDSLGGALAAADRVKEPVRAFLLANAGPRERGSFLALAREMRPPVDRTTVSDRDFLVLAPAFVVSELRRAFEIGFMLFLPFLVVDLVVANLLVGLGMTSLSPALVALPFKLLLFVLVDGWHLVARGLVQSYL